MKLKYANAFLNHNGLQHPILEALKPSVDEYDVLLIQPKGEIKASKSRVGNHNQQLATEQYSKLLEEASNEQINLVVAPEYCIPWNSIKFVINNDQHPAKGSLWALGCESITIAELESLKDDLNGKAHILYENLDIEAAKKKSFLDPLAYVFHTKDGNDEDCLVILIQFKTHISIDDERIEGDNLFTGESVYVFGTKGETIRLFSLICSDAFAAKEETLKNYLDRTIILHIQLNPNPRQDTFRSYREHFFKYAKYESELICLNWASNIHECIEDGDEKDWKNIAGSAWYLRPDKFDYSDKRINENHSAGLYFTHLKSMKWNVMFLNYNPGAYILRASKVWHDENVAAVQSKRIGPRLQDVLQWEEANKNWISNPKSEDGFKNLLQPFGEDTDPLSKMYEINPIYVERFLALIAGEISSAGKWHSVTELDSFTIDLYEYIKRITFAQDTEQVCVDFRNARVRNFVSCCHVLNKFTKWPPELSDLSVGYEFVWEPDCPHSTVKSNAGEYATLVYMGEDRLETELKAVGEKLRTALHRKNQPTERLGVFYRKQGQPEVWLHPDSRRFDKPSDTSPVDFTGG